MVGVGVSLARRLPYDIWRASHWLLGLAVMLAVAHLAALGHTHPLLGLPILALAFMLWQALRGGGLNARPFIMDHVAHPAADSVDVRIKPLTLPIEADTGQFVLAAFGAGPDFKGCGEFHPYPLTGVRLDGQISLGIKALGSCTRQLQALNTGVAVRIQGLRRFRLPGQRAAGHLAGGRRRHRALHRKAAQGPAAVPHTPDLPVPRRRRRGLP